LDVLDHMPGISFEPLPVEILYPELDAPISGEVLWLDFPSLLLPPADQGGLIVAHDDAGVRASDEVAAVCV
jgi:hypothetical protein